MNNEIIPLKTVIHLLSQSLAERDNTIRMKGGNENANLNRKKCKDKPGGRMASLWHQHYEEMKTPGHQVNLCLSKTASLTKSEENPSTNEWINKM